MTNKITSMEYSATYFLISTISMCLLGIIIGIFCVVKDLEYSNEKIFLLGIIGIIGLIIWGFSSIMIFKKFQESISRTVKDEEVSARKQDHIIN